MDLSVLKNPSEHLSDEERIDQAQQLHTDAALLQHQLMMAAAAKLPVASECDACGNSIPLARRQQVAGVRLCVECQRERERRERLFR